MASKPKENDTGELMVVNDSPGEECRIAILQDGHLDELYTERTSSATNVGNIYKGRVTNVESAIQAAFVDYGEGQAGFLHISDLHPRYFPGNRKTERVGKKIPRRARPPMQEALRRGDEVLVQVLKEGIGTKGPTLTSYLSIPGRLLVMMPDMDRVGVSRKVEDPDKRREMRQILDSLELPDGFGFILRTAGFGKSKTELKRDVAYLTRLWKTMEKRRQSERAPCELYTESDLFVRTIRDVLRPSIGAIIVDSDQAYERGRALLRVVAPRSAPKLVRYREAVPIFHAFDVERQIELIHEREVPLPSGGKLVIEQTEALVAIDVNSGRSRSARDAETNAYETNCEAVDEICRQLRLRDLGGVVINDLIDMRAGRNRRRIEERFKQGLARDRAKTTMLRISDFGIVELTRQRMRPSLRKSHFMPCPECRGHGEIKTPESVGSDATRQVGYLLQFNRVRRVELVCSPRVASYLLSAKRRELVRLEETFGKKIDVRVSETIVVDRVDFYAYDERSADVDVSKLSPPRPPSLDQLASRRGEAEPEPRREPKREPGKEAEAPKQPAAADAEKRNAPPETPGEPRRRRRRRRRRRARSGAEAGGSEGRQRGEPQTEAAGEQAADAADDAGKAKAEGPAGDRDGRKRRHRGDGDRKVRVHELARQLGAKSRDVLARCRSIFGDAVSNHMSSISPDDAEVVRRRFADAKRDASGAGDGSEAQQQEKQPDDAGGRERPKKKGRRSRRRSRKGGRPDAEGERSAEAQPAKEPGRAGEAKSEKDGDKPPRGGSRRRRRGDRSRSGTRGGANGSPADADAKKPDAQEGDAADTLDEARSGRAAKSPLYRNRRRLSRSAARQLLETESEQ